MEERQAVFGEANDLYKTGRKKEAADRLVVVAEDPANEMFHAEAYARLGAILKELELPYSALIAYSKALEASPQAVASEVKKMIELGDVVGDTALLEPLLAQNVGLSVDKDTQSRMAYLAARGANRTGSYATALAILKMVSDKDPNYAEAKQLEGIVLSLQGRPKDALAPLLIAEAILKQREASAANDKQLVELHMNIARAYYGAENFGRAVEYFAMIPRTSDLWVEAQFERAWAHFRLDDMNGVLGLTETHASPFLAKAYFPEAALLRVYALFMMCKFPQANKEIEAFTTQYTGTLETLRAQSDRSAEDSVRGDGDGGRPSGQERPAEHGGDAVRARDAVPRSAPCDRERRRGDCAARRGEGEHVRAGMHPVGGSAQGGRDPDRRQPDPRPGRGDGDGALELPRQRASLEARHHADGDAALRAGGEHRCDAGAPQEGEPLPAPGARLPLLAVGGRVLGR